MFGLPRWASFLVMGIVTIAIFFGLFQYVDTVQKEQLKAPKPMVDQAAECALLKMTFKMKRAQALAEHKYTLATIKGEVATYPEPSDNQTFLSLVKSCLPKGADKQAQVDSAKRLGIMLAFDDEYGRLMLPFKREQERAMLQRK